MLLLYCVGGGIIISSTHAGRQGMPLITCYASMKAFGWILAESMYQELHDLNVDVIAPLIGATSTPSFIYGIKHFCSDPKFLQGPHVCTPLETVQAALGALEDRRPSGK